MSFWANLFGGKPDEGAPYPLLLLVSRAPDDTEVRGIFGPAFEAIADTIGVYRRDILSPEWDAKRSFRVLAENPDKITPQDLKRLAAKAWGSRCTNGTKITVIQLVSSSWLLTVTKPWRAE